MKKILLPILLFAAVAKAQIVTIPDATFKSLLVTYPVALDVNDNPMIVDANGNGEIEASEAQAVFTLSVAGQNVSDLTGIEAFTNLKRLDCQVNNLSSLNINGLVNLEQLYCFNNNLSTLNITGLTNLQYLDCGVNHLTTLDISTLTGLTILTCSSNQLTALDLSGLNNLSFVDCSMNSITLLNLPNSSTLTGLNCSFNQLLGIPLAAATGIGNLNCAGNNLFSLDVSVLPQLTIFNCSTNNLSALDVTNNTQLTTFNCNNNAIASIDVSANMALTEFDCSYNHLSSLDVTANTALTSLDCSANTISALNVLPLVNLKTLKLATCQIPALNLSTLTQLQNLVCNNNLLTTIDLSNNTNLLQLYCGGNSLTALDLSNVTQLFELSYGNQTLPTVDFSNLTNLTILFFENTGRTSADLANLPNLRYYNCSANPMATVDVSHQHQMQSFGCGSAELTELFMKNGVSEQFSVVNSPNLAFVCADEAELPYVLSVIVPSGSTNAVATSYCDFVPGGDYNTISGQIHFDVAGDGCDASDIPADHLKIGITGGTTAEASLINNQADYAFYTGQGNFTIAPQLENPTYFTVSPPSADINFPALDNSTQTQNFCITANGIHPDLEVVLTPIGRARPGFNANYLVVYKNKGNQVFSGTVNVTFDDAHTDFISAVPDLDSQTLNSLIWNYTNLLPFETRSIYFSLNVNSPTETPAVNAGDVLDFTANINYADGDETPQDNISVLHQVTSNSLDPNEKSCLEGAAVSPEDIGNYLHYNIEFENTGNDEATNVVVKDIIDTTKFDINSLQVLYSSNEMYTRIRGNTVEFVFENINLAPVSGTPPVGGHGDVLFKIKTLSTLSTGDLVENKADIYFDYNAPITTNTARTTFQLLANPDFVADQSVKVYPNPTASHLNISCSSSIKTIELFDIQGRILEMKNISANATMLDLSDKSQGIYFVRINTDKGVKVEKIIRE